MIKSLACSVLAVFSFLECLAQSGEIKHPVAQTSGSQSPAIVGSKNTIIIENNTRVNRVTPSTSRGTEKILKEKAKTYLGSETAWDGVLIPSHESTPPSKCASDAQTFTVFLGKGPSAFTCSVKDTCVLFSGARTSAATASVDDPSSLLSLTKSGPTYAISGKMLGSDGKLIALFRDNKIYTNKQQVSLVERPDPSTLHILDLGGNLILSLDYINPQSMLLSGTFYSVSGGSVQASTQGLYISRFNSFLSNSCFSNNSVGIVF